MMFWQSKHISPDPLDMLWHYARGEMPCYLGEETEEVGWVKYNHRGVQFLDKIRFPRREMRYIYSPKFEIHYNRAFEEVLRACARPAPNGRRSWITPEVFEGFATLHELGHAHSYEAWHNGELAGGCIGIHIGGFITCESMFYRVSNASKAAYGQTLVRLQERGFKWIDTNCVATHHVNYGEEWVPQWKFEQMLREAIRENHSLADDIPCAPVPWQLRFGLPVVRLAGAIGRRLRLRAASI